MCSGARSSSANGAIAARAAPACSWSTSSSTVLSDCTISGPSVISSIIQGRRTPDGSVRRGLQWGARRSRPTAPARQRNLPDAGRADLAGQPRQRRREDVHRERPVVVGGWGGQGAGGVGGPGLRAQRVGGIALITGFVSGAATAE